MPAGGVHLCVAKEIERKLDKKFSYNYYLGNIAPDSWRNTKSSRKTSHFAKIVDNNYIYDYDYFYSKYHSHMKNDYVLGYLIHLITDKYWYGNNFITSHLSENNNKELMKACSNLINIYKIPMLVKYYKIINPIEELTLDGLNSTIDYLNSVNYVNKFDSIYDTNLLLESINKTSDYVIMELQRLNKIYGGLYE